MDYPLEASEPDIHGQVPMVYRMVFAAQVQAMGCHRERAGQREEIAVGYTASASLLQESEAVVVAAMVPWEAHRFQEGPVQEVQVQSCIAVDSHQHPVSVALALALGPQSGGSSRAPVECLCASPALGCYSWRRRRPPLDGPRCRLVEG